METLLIIDDEIDLRESLAEILSGIFDEIVTLGDGVQALNHIKLHNPQMIISDVMMPKLDGIQLMTQIKSLGFHDIPVILITGQKERELLFQAVRLGVSDVLEKPFTPQSIIQTVNRVKEICRRKNNIAQLELIHGKESNQVHHEKKMLGLLETVNSLKKTV